MSGRRRHALCTVAAMGTSLIFGSAAMAHESSIAIPYQQESAWDEVALVNDDTVSTGAYVRSAADANSQVIGCLYNGGAAWVINRGEEWTEIYSGGLTGFVKNEYLVCGEDAKALAEGHGVEGVATTWSDVKLYAGADGGSAVLDSLDYGDSFILTQDEGHWLQVQSGADSTAYVSAEDVSRVLLLDTAVPTDAAYLDAEASGEESYGDGGEAFYTEETYSDDTYAGESGTGDAAVTNTDESYTDLSYTSDPYANALYAGENYADESGTDASYDESYADTTGADASYDEPYGDTTDTDASYGESYDNTTDADASYDESYGDTTGTDASYDESYADTTDADASYDESYSDTTDTSYTDESYSDGSTDAGVTPGTDTESYYDASTGIYYDASTGLYYDSGTGILYDAWWNPVNEAIATPMAAGGTETSDDSSYDDRADEADVSSNDYSGDDSQTSSAGTDDTSLLAALIYCEAGNQSYDGMVAVGAVVMNRVNSPLFPNSISEVIYQSGQFTPASSGGLASALANGVPSACYDAAAAAIGGENPVGDALYFNTGSGKGVKLGDHQFY